MKSTKQVNLSLGIVTVEKLKRLCRRDNLTPSRLIDDLINDRYYKLQYKDGVEWAPIRFLTSQDDDDILKEPVPDELRVFFETDPDKAKRDILGIDEMRCNEEAQNL